MKYNSEYFAKIRTSTMVFHHIYRHEAHPSEQVYQRLLITVFRELVRAHVSSIITFQYPVL